MNNNKFRKKQIKYISVDEFNQVLNYVKNKYNIYYRPKSDDEPFKRFNCYITDKKKNISILYKIGTTTYNYGCHLDDGTVYNQLNPGTSLRTLGKYYKIPEIKELYPELKPLCQSYKLETDGIIGMRIDPLLMFNRKFEGQRLYAYCYDMNSAYSWAMLQDMPDTSNGYVANSIVGDNEIGFKWKPKEDNINDYLGGSAMAMVGTGKFANYIFPKMKSPFGRFVDKWYNKKVNAKDAEEKSHAKEMLNFCIGCLQNHNPFIRCAIVSYCNQRIMNIITNEIKNGNEFIYANTDCLTMTKPLNYLDIGNDVGQWKIKEGYFAFKGCNYQWDLEIPTYRGMPKKWFPASWDILKDPIPEENNIYKFDLNKMEIVENEKNN